HSLGHAPRSPGRDAHEPRRRPGPPRGRRALAALRRTVHRGGARLLPRRRAAPRLVLPDWRDQARARRRLLARRSPPRPPPRHGRLPARDLGVAALAARRGHPQPRTPRGDRLLPLADARLRADQPGRGSLDRAGRQARLDALADPECPGAEALARLAGHADRRGALLPDGVQARRRSARPVRISRTIRSATSAVMSAEPGAVGITSTTSATTSSSFSATVRQAQSRSPLSIPPGSGVPVPGAKAGSSTSTSTLRNTAPGPIPSIAPPPTS